MPRPRSPTGVWGNMKISTILALTALLIALIGLAVGWQLYAWQECRRVGHSSLYCMMRIGR